MGKKFKDAAASASPVYSKIIGTRQETQAHDAQEVQEVQHAQEAQTTQGRKGMKQPRINMAFTPENLNYLRTMAGMKGISTTKYVNDMVAQERMKNAELYKEAKRITGTI